MPALPARRSLLLVPWHPARPLQHAHMHFMHALTAALPAPTPCPLAAARCAVRACGGGLRAAGADAGGEAGGMERAEGADRRHLDGCCYRRRRRSSSISKQQQQAGFRTPPRPAVICLTPASPSLAAPSLAFYRTSGCGQRPMQIRCRPCRWSTWQLATTAARTTAPAASRRPWSGCDGPERARTLPLAPAAFPPCRACRVPCRASANRRRDPSPCPAPPPQFSRLHADMTEESRHDRAALQQLASSLAAPASIPLLK